MAKRILMVITPETTGDLGRAARSAAGVARDSGGQVRMVFVRPIPPPRLVLGLHVARAGGPAASRPR